MFKAFGDPVKIKRGFPVELEKHMLRPFNGTGNKLREKHDIKRIYAKMPFCFLVIPVYLNGIAHRLEGMKRQSDRKQIWTGKVWDFQLQIPLTGWKGFRSENYSI